MEATVTISLSHVKTFEKAASEFDVQFEFFGQPTPTTVRYHLTFNHPSDLYYVGCSVGEGLSLQAINRVLQN